MKKNPKSRPFLVLGRYELCEEIGKGSFGSVYTAHDRKSGRKVAVKIENETEQSMATKSQLRYEHRVYKLLRKSGVTGVPLVHHFGTVRTKRSTFNVLVMDLLGPDLHIISARRPLSPAVVCTIAAKGIDLLRQIHRCGLIHRDLKPNNFCIGAHHSESALFLIDFGLSKRFVDPADGQHIKYRTDKSLTGTPRYASTHAHCGKEQSRRDDLYSFGFVLVFLAKGRLPWQGVRASTKQKKHEKITKMKIGIKPQSLCTGLPRAFETYMLKCRALGFYDEPNYDSLAQPFLDYLTEHGGG